MADETPRIGQALSRQEFEQDVIHRASEDARFRQELLADPKAAIKTAYGVEIPPDVDLQVLEETRSRFYLVLPVQSAELTEEELAAVAGGFGIEAFHTEQSIASPTLVNSFYFAPRFK